MARRKEFDPEAALDAAMRLFWRNGYEGTSTSDLVDELGIARASLYGTFGSKRGLYLAALDRFLSGGAGPSPADILASRASALDAVRDLLETSAAAPEPDRPQGCFAVNATVEHGDSDPEIARRLEGNRSRLETALYGALLRARAEGELAPGVDPRSAATMLASLNSGLKVLSCAGADQRDRITSCIDAVMAMLTPPAAAVTD
ncbi:TetR/AcrR family transcriptional regulator [Streptomyces rhizosphaericus]|uniref:TetR/AcrR family transcriptional regulator n=1 Tax=Streptomyces rhizosphaericus TaxID=114699 RepID=A0A6G4ABT5_9ACTN|nr:TetR/AcrR family transcriptional regulator [Streptomyces rhizosphaericus]NEW70151.1 TetR/AcrR family transcriptional regulator [Streptomyces rhizosphaericus]